MTLVSRNKLLLTFFILSITFTFATSILFTTRVLNNNIILPQEFHRIMEMPHVPLFHSNFFAAVLSAIFVVLYVSITLCLCLVHFEKTQSVEIIYFSGFLMGAALEGARIWILSYNLWLDNSHLYTLIGNTLFFGRSLAVTSLLALAFLSLEVENNQNIGLSLIVLCALSALLAKAMPIDTLTIPSNCGIRFGYERLFLLIESISLTIGFCSILYQGRERDSREYVKVGYGYILLGFGYIILTQADALFSLIMGIAMLVGGTTLFLWYLHRFHKWK